VIGSKIDGKYLVKSLLGQGGMGSVYEVEHTATGRRCAVKVINSGDLTKDQQVLSRFEREARAAGAIDTQYITQVLDAGIDRESQLPFMAMEYLDGEDLQRMLKRVGPIAPDLTMRIVAQACLGLKKAHDAKVVHRDIKPHNLFLAERDAGEIIVKLLDFGIAKMKMEQAQTAEGADLTRTGNLLGSPLYVSPEQARGKREINHRTDIYSLGAVMYQMLCGRTPYEHATALGELILMICTEPPAPLQDHAPWVPAALAEIVHKCLRKNPDERYQTAQELFDDIAKMLPDGWKIHQSMLVSLEDSQRAQLAPRASVSEPPPADMESGTYGTVTGPVTASTGDAGSTTGPLVHSHVTPEPQSKLPMVAVATLVFVLAGGGVWAITRGNDPPIPGALTSTPETSPAGTPTELPVTPPPEPEKSLRVRVAVRPKEASVEVDGKVRAVKDGNLELEGVPGTVFKVRAFQGTSETEGEIIITQEGPRPPLIEVEIGKKTTFRPQPTQPSAEPSTAPMGVPPGIQTSFPKIEGKEDEFN
jgi:serine/threonine-protein kinase